MSFDESIPATMRAAVLVGDSPNLRIVEVEVPTPAAGEALVRVSACGVCHTDLHVLKGEVAFPRPAVLGHEISGTVVRFGDGSQRLAGLSLGDSVVAGFIMPCAECARCLEGRDDLCTKFFELNRMKGVLYDGTSRLAMPDGSFLAMYSMGGLAEYAVVPISALAKLPADLELQKACILGCAGLTSYGAVHRAGHVRSGHVVAVIGCGGIGSNIIQMARAAGASTIVAVDISREKLESAGALGATHLLNAKEVDPIAYVKERFGGVDVAFEALGTPRTFAQASRMLADGGRMVAVGIAAGGMTGEVDITPLVRRGQSVVGSFGARTREDLPQVISLAASGQFDHSQTITRTFRLGEVDDAYQALSRGEITGRAIVVMNDGVASQS